MSYHQFKDENGEEYGSVEVFQLTAQEVAERDEDLCHEYMRRHEFRLASMNSRTREAMLNAIVEEQGITGGWFWKTYGDAMGPFSTRSAAINNAQSS